MKIALFIAAICLLGICVFAAEKPVTFVPARADAATGDWQSDGGFVAQVIATADATYQANLLHSFEAADKPAARGNASTEFRNSP